MASKLIFSMISYLGALASGSATGVQLPFVPITDGVQVKETTSGLERDGKWWASFGNQVYHQPASLLGLSTEVSSYYYAIGSEEALSDDMRKHRVGGEGRWHIFHLPKNQPASFLQQFGNPGDRRQSFSSLMQLESGTKIAKTFPEYPVDTAYKNPLTAHGQDKEKTAVGLVTEASVKEILTRLEEMPTRSFSDPGASEAAEKFIQEELDKAGITNCLQDFKASNTDMKNIVGIIPGKSPGSVTVGAHYDSRPFIGTAPGAEDNGSGVASLLAIASAYKAAKIQPLKTIFFVGFAGEERGLLGSSAFAKAMKEGSEGIPKKCQLPSQGSFLQTQSSMDMTMHQAIIMDEVGWLSKDLAAFPKPTVNLEALDVADPVMKHLAQASRQYNGDALRIVHNNAPFGSDHMSFSDRGMPAVLTINGDDDRYPDYHKSTDTIDNVNMQYLSQITKMDMGGLVRLSGVLPAPDAQTEEAEKIGFVRSVVKNINNKEYAKKLRVNNQRRQRVVKKAVEANAGLMSNVLDSIGL